MTIAKAKTILAKDMRCRMRKTCKGNCLNCKDFVVYDEQITEAEKVVLEWIKNRQESDKLKMLYG